MRCWPDILEKELVGWPREPEEPGKEARWSCRFCPCVGDMHGRKVVLEKASTMCVFLKKSWEAKVACYRSCTSHKNGLALVSWYSVISWEQLMKCSPEHRRWGFQSFILPTADLECIFTTLQRERKIESHFVV